MARYGQEFDRGRRGMRTERGFGYGAEFERGVRGEYGGVHNEYGGVRGQYGGLGGGQYEGTWTGGRGTRGGWTGYGRDYGFGAEGLGGREFGRGATGRGYTGWGERGMGGRRTMGYAGTEPTWGGRDTGYDIGYATPSGRYTSRGLGGRTTGGRTNTERTRASTLMTENPESVTPDATIADAAKKMKDLDVGIIPVVDDMENRRLRGVVTDRDLAIRALAEGKDGKTKVSDCMTTDVSTVNKNDTVDDVLNLMRTEQVRRVPVTDREGRLVGIIAQADLAVDFAENQPDREMEVEEAIERISEPAHPRRRGSYMR